MLEMSKDKKGQLNAGGFVMLAMGIIVAIVLLTQVFNTQNQLTDKQFVNGESVSRSSARVGSTDAINTSYTYTVTNYPSGWKLQDCPLTNFALGNSTGNYTLTTDYVVNLTAGTFTLKNTVPVNDSSSNASYVYYSYCADGYNKDGSSRSMARLIGLFGALALLAFVAYHIKMNY